MFSSPTLSTDVGLAGLSRRDHARWLWRTVGRRTPLASRKLWLGVAVVTVATAVTAVVVVQALWGLLLA